MKNKTKFIILISLSIFAIFVFCACSALTEYFPYLWWTMLISFAIFIAIFVYSLIIYMQHIQFICAKCETQFKAKNKDIILAIHTPTRRYLRCPNCGEKSWCKETFIDNFIDKDNERM